LKFTSSQLNWADKIRESEKQNGAYPYLSILSPILFSFLVHLARALSAILFLYYPRVSIFSPFSFYSAIVSILSAILFF